MSDDRIHPAAGRGFEVSVEHYERGRPGYPDDAVTYLVRELGVGEGRDVLELGAGTGSTVVIRAPVCTMSSVNLPVPAPSSRTSRPSPTP